MPKHTPEEQLNTAADIAAAAPSTPDAPITQAQLIALLTSIVSGQQKSESALATAIIEGLKESQKPYVDPKKEENEELFRQQARRIEETRRSNERASQQHCPHIAGCNGLSTSRDYQGRTCIIWHQFHPNAPAVGICTNCQKEFHSTDADYLTWRSIPSVSTPSTCGYPIYVNENEGEGLTGSTCFAAWEEPKFIYDDESSDPNLWTPSKLDEEIKNEMKAEFVKAGNRKAELV